MLLSNSQKSCKSSERRKMNGQFKPFEVVKNGLNGFGPKDELFDSSVAVLADRLERLKRSSDLYRDVQFSPDVQVLADKQMALVAVG